MQALLSFSITAAVVYFLVVKPLNRRLARFATGPDVGTPTLECPSA